MEVGLLVSYLLWFYTMKPCLQDTAEEIMVTQEVPDVMADTSGCGSSGTSASAWTSPGNRL
jgi:hypothetical protein